MLYLANCTKQMWRHCYRVPETGGTGMIDIPSGQQREIGANWSPAQTAEFISHLELFGARNVSETNIKMAEFDGYLYSTTKPISSDNIHVAHEALVDKQERTSAAEATKSALAFDASSRSSGKGGRRLAKVSEVEVVQDLAPREKATGNEVSFRLSVENDGTENFKIPA